MKKFVIVLMVLTSTLSLSAQRGNGGERGGNRGGGDQMTMEERQHKELTELTELLSLNEEQVAGVVKLQVAFSSEMEKNRESMSENSDRKAMREEMMAMRNKYNEDIKSLLDSDQKEIYDNYTTEQEEKMKEHGPQGNRPERK